MRGRGGRGREAATEAYAGQSGGGRVRRRGRRRDGVEVAGLRHRRGHGVSAQKDKGRSQGSGRTRRS